MNVDFSTCLQTKCYTYSLVCLNAYQQCMEVYYISYDFILILLLFVMFVFLVLWLSADEDFLQFVKNSFNIWGSHQKIECIFTFSIHAQKYWPIWRPVQKIHFYHFVQKCGTEAGTKCASFSIWPLFSIIDFTHAPIVQVMFLLLTPHVKPLWLVYTFNISPEHCGPLT